MLKWKLRKWGLKAIWAWMTGKLDDEKKAEVPTEEDIVKEKNICDYTDEELQRICDDVNAVFLDFSEARRAAQERAGLEYCFAEVLCPEWQPKLVADDTIVVYKQPEFDGNGQPLTITLVNSPDKKWPRKRKQYVHKITTPPNAAGPSTTRKRKKRK